MEIQNKNHKDEQNIIFYNSADGKVKVAFDG
jgi:hypothetical protein